MKKFFSIFLALALVLAILPVAGVQAQKPVAFESSIQIRNLSGDAGAVTIAFYNLAGNLVETAEDSIAAYQTKSYYQSTMPVDAGFNGSVVVASNVPTAGMSNLVGLKTGGKPMTYGAFSAFNAGATTVYLPTLMKGNWGYDTFFYVQNLGAEKATVTVKYSDGLEVELADIKPGAAKAVKQMGEEHAKKVFSAILTSDQPIAATVAQDGPTLLAYNGFGAGAVKPIMPLVQENNWGYFSGIQIQNTGATDTDVTVEYDPSLAGTACKETQTIPAGESKTFAQGVFYSGATHENDCTKGERFIGSAAVTVNSAGHPLVATVNQLNSKDVKGGSYNAFDPNAGGSTIIYPLIMDRVFGYFTSWSIVNVGDAEIPAGGIVCTVTGGTVNKEIKNDKPVAEGESWTLNHVGLIAEKFVGGATCKAAGAKILGTSNQLGSGKDYNGVDSFLVSEGFIVP